MIKKPMEEEDIIELTENIGHFSNEVRSKLINAALEIRRLKKVISDMDALADVDMEELEHENKKLKAKLAISEFWEKEDKDENNTL